MNTGHWLIYLVSPSIRADKKARVPRFLVALFLCVCLLGTAGFARCLWFFVSYSYAKIGVYNLRHENSNLQKTIRFLEKFASGKEQDVKQLALFENTARLKFGINSVSEDVRKAGVGGLPDAEEMLLASFEDQPVRHARFVRNRIEALLRQLDLQDSTFSRMAYHVDNQYSLWAQRPSIWPARGRVTSGYGYRFHPFFRRNMFHDGIDIGNKVWTPIFAAANGLVSKVGFLKEYGNLVKIAHHASGYETVYAHLRQSAVVEGQVVKRGEVIGYMGNSGRSTGPHLHYEVRKFGKHTNPMNYILPQTAVID